MLLRNLILPLLMLFSFSSILAMSEKDSLISLVKKTTEINKKIDLLNELSWVVYNENPSDAKIYGKQALDLCEKTNYPEGQTDALNKMGIYEKCTGNYEEALKCYMRSREICISIKDSIGLCMVLNNIGNVHKNKGDYALALETFMEALKLNEKINEKDGIADVLLNIGLIYDDLAKRDLAVDYLTRSLKIAQEIKDKKRISRALNNIANLLSEGNKDDMRKSLEYYDQAYKLDKETGDMKGQSMCLNNIGAVYFELGEWDKASSYYHQSLIIKKEIGDRKGMAVIYENLGLVEKKRNNYPGASLYFEKSLAFCDSIGDAPLRIDVLKSLAENYMLMKDYIRSAAAFRELYYFSDSIFSREMSDQLSEMQAKYEAEKKDKEILGLQKDKEINEKEISRQKTVRYFMTGIALLILLLLGGSVYAFLEKRKANRVLALKNQEITQQKEEITAQRDEIEAQRDEIVAQRNILFTQKEHIEDIHKELTDSITYAKRIQQAMLPDLGNVLLRQQLAIDSRQSDLRIADCLLPTADYFILYKPKDIVSGDFYWATRINEWLIFAVADCTGHGVPGGFMSMLGISYLNEIVRKKEVTKASDVLEQLRTEIIDALQQKEDNDEVFRMKDGMDISVCAYNSETNVLQFAGANNPLYIIKRFENLKMNQFENENTNENATIDQFSNLQINTSSNQLIELKPNRQPVGIYINMQPFTNHEIILSPGDTIYLMSDGFQDQFGGPDGKKYMAKRLREKILSISSFSMADQKKALMGEFSGWIGSGEQMDDVTVLGIKI